MAIPRKQRVVMAIIVAVGLVVACAVLLADRRGPVSKPVEAGVEHGRTGEAGRIALSPEQVRRAGITTATAGPTIILAS